jgi:hypothetical protein
MYVCTATEFLSKMIAICLSCDNNCKSKYIHAKHHTHYQYFENNIYITVVMQFYILKS